MKSYTQLFAEHSGRLVHKWAHYFEIYDRYLGRFRGKSPKVLEIGVFHGGSAQLWKKYFGKGSQIIGVDINPECLNYSEDRIKIEIGDQGDIDFWSKFISEHGPFDIILDDGSHLNNHMIMTFASCWETVSDGGVYMAEDTHTCYWASYRGGLRARYSFIEYCKDRIDDQHAFWSQDTSLQPNLFTHEIGGLHFYDSVVIIEKKLRASAPQALITGTPSRVLDESFQATFNKGCLHFKDWKDKFNSEQS